MYTVKHTVKKMFLFLRVSQERIKIFLKIPTVLTSGRKGVYVKKHCTKIVENKVFGKKKLKTDIFR